MVQNCDTVMKKTNHVLSLSFSSPWIPLMAAHVSESCSSLRKSRYCKYCNFFRCELQYWEKWIIKAYFLPESCQDITLWSTHNTKAWIQMWWETGANSKNFWIILWKWKKKKQETENAKKKEDKLTSNGQFSQDFKKSYEIAWAFYPIPHITHNTCAWEDYGYKL